MTLKIIITVIVLLLMFYSKTIKRILEKGPMILFRTFVISLYGGILIIIEKAVDVLNKTTKTIKRWLNL